METDILYSKKKIKLDTRKKFKKLLIKTNTKENKGVKWKILQANKKEIVFLSH